MLPARGYVYVCMYVCVFRLCGCIIFEYCYHILQIFFFFSEGKGKRWFLQREGQIFMKARVWTV